jgi:hypothetical protein
VASCEPVRVEALRIVMMAAKRDGCGSIAARSRAAR